MKRGLLKSKYLLILFFVSTLVFSFSYGILVGRFKIFPYDSLKNVWSSASGVKKVVAPALEGTVSGQEKSMIETNLMVIEAHKYNIMGEHGLMGDGGALEKVGDVVLGVDREGSFFSYEPGGVVVKMNINVDMNKNSFLDYMQGHIEREGTRRNADRYFRVLDLAARETERGVELVVSHHYWDDEAQGKRMRVSRLLVNDMRVLLEGQRVGAEAWEVLYESYPPIPFGDPPHKAIITNHTGGRMAFDRRGNLIVGIGEHRFDGISYPQIAAQDDTSSYGKLIRIDLETGQTGVYAKGVRNPQGMLLDRDGNLWESEHGPRGGDELNLIHEGGNYGWPFVTYGTEENAFAWPHNKRQGHHDEYVRPVYAWVPSIGISNLIQVDNAAHPWDGDLLVSSLAGLTLYRLHVREGRVVLAEPIRIGERIRDLLMLDDGTILLFADNARFIELKPASQEEESVAFQFTAQEREMGLDEVINYCATCHSFSRAAGGGSAPPLWGVWGRDIAGSEYPNYSGALRRVEGVWNEEALVAYLTNPQRFAPGTTMPDPGLVDEATLKAVVDYLKRLR